MKPLELSHDIIAKKVWERLPEIDKQLQAVKKSLIQREKDWFEGKGSFLGAKELAGWKEPIERLRSTLDQKVLDFIEDSQKDVTTREQTRWWIILGFGTLLVLATIISLIFAFKAKEQTKVAEKAQQGTKLALEEAELAKSKATTALDSLRNLLIALKDNELINEEGDGYNQLINRFSKMAENGKYLIRFLYLKSEENEVEQLKDYFKLEGYNLILFQRLERRPSYFSRNGKIIFYYDASLKETAEKLATALASLTKKEFKAINRGTQGTGIIEGLETTLMNIHYAAE